MADKPGPILPQAFFSYTRFDDQHEERRLTQLRERLESAVRAHTGLKITIFQDIRMAWGDKWAKQIDAAVAGSCFFIPVITPSYFRSSPCEEELTAFLAHQVKQGAGGVVLPIYWIEADEFSDPDWRDAIPTAKFLAACQYTDWRNRRIEPLDSVESARLLDGMAQAVKKQLKAMGVLKPPTRPSVPASAKAMHPADPGTSRVADSPPSSELAPRTDAVPTPKPKRRELVVDLKGGAGTFRSIADAVRAAQPEDVILVRPGLYEQPVIINKVLTILGDGPKEEIILKVPDANVIKFTAAFGRVANLTLRQAGGQFYAVDIAGGRLELEECDISSGRIACVGVHDGADPLIRGNRIHDSDSAGVSVYQNSRGTYENNDILGNAITGIYSAEGGDPYVRGNRIHDGRGSGIFVNNSGRGTFEDNDIFGNARAGVVVQGFGDPSVRGNRINRNGFEAIWVHSGGRGRYTNNDLRDNQQGPWDVAADCLPDVVLSDNIES